MKKFMNFRIMLVLIVSLIASILSATYLFVAENSKLFLFIVFIILAISFAVALLMLKKKIFAVFCVILFVVSFPFLQSYLTSVRLNQNKTYFVTNTKFIGKINKIDVKLDKGYARIELTDICINQDLKCEYFGNVCVYSSINGLDVSRLDVGTKLLILSKVDCFTLQDENISKVLSSKASNITGTCSIHSYNLVILEEKETSLRDKIKIAVSEKLKQSETKHADVGFAMLFGESSVVDSSVLNSFRSTGIVHLLAVSGLHISLLVLVLSFLLDKLNIRKLLKVAIIALFLIFYMYICGFSVSVVRASIMAIVLLYSRYRCKEYDNLSVLCFAALLILIINPFDLFSVSFLLSFASVLSIILLMPLFSRLFEKVLRKKLSSALALTISVQLGIFAVQVYYFHTFSISALFANIICVPIATFAYILLFFALLLSFVLPFLTPLCSVFGQIMSLVVSLNFGISEFLPMVTIEGRDVIILLISLILMFTASDYVFLKKKVKIPFCLTLTIALMFMLVI